MTILVTDKLMYGGVSYVLLSLCKSVCVWLSKETYLLNWPRWHSGLYVQTLFIMHLWQRLGFSVVPSAVSVRQISASNSNSHNVSDFIILIVKL